MIVAALSLEVVDLQPGIHEIAVSDPDDGFWPPREGETIEGLQKPFVPSQVAQFTAEAGDKGLYIVRGQIARWTSLRPRPKHLVDYYYRGWDPKIHDSTG